ncbi:MAG: ChaN family lipoprotein [Desulfuromonadales bacterium]
MTSSFRNLLHAGLILLPLAAGCSANTAAIGDPQSPYPPPKPPQVGDILHIPTGYYVDESEMLDAIGDSRIVYVGETHDNPAAHRLELTVLRGVSDRHPGKVALGMEMFTPSQQDALDRWVAGELSEKEFLKESGWYQQWNMDFALFRDILVFARDHDIPILGLNADKDMVRKVGRQGVEALSEEERRKVPELDMDDPYHRAMTEAIFGDHDSGGNMLESFLRVQTLWDETMAASIADYLSGEDRKDHHMVVMAGGNHVRFGYGIPRRVFRRLPTSYALVGSREIDIPEDKKDRMMNVDPPPLPMEPYDYLVYTEYEELETNKAQLGVRFEEIEDGIEVLAIVPESAAAEAGLKAGDILLSIEGTRLEDSFDLIYEIGQRQPGDEVMVEYLRDDEKKEITLTLQEPRHGMKEKHGSK